MNTNLRIVISALLLLILTLACGSTTPQTTISTAVVDQSQPSVDPTIAPTKPLGKVGETVTQGAYSITLANVETATTYGDFITAAAGNKYVSVELIIQSGAATGVSVNPFYVTLKDSSGYEYTTALLGKEPTLKSQNDLPAGELVRGWITFEVPETSSGFTLSYDPLSFDGTKIRFDLGQ